MLKYTLVREVKKPTRGTKGSAGIDLYVPTGLITPDINKFRTDGKFGGDVNSKGIITVYPHDRVCIPSGVHFNLDAGHALIAFNKSGIATKKGLIVGACVVDEDYEGEVHISLINTTSKPVSFESGAKIVQFLYVPVNMKRFQCVKDLDALYKSSKSERKAGGFGSTND